MLNADEISKLSSPKGMLYMGIFYEYGIGVERDKRKAFEYYKSIAL